MLSSVLPEKKKSQIKTQILYPLSHLSVCFVINFFSGAEVAFTTLIYQTADSSGDVPFLQHIKGRSYAFMTFRESFTP